MEKCIYKQGDIVYIPALKSVGIGYNYKQQSITINTINTGYVEGVYLLSGMFSDGFRSYYITFHSDQCEFV